MTKTEACWDRTEGCCMTEAFERGMRQPKRRRAANGQSVSRNTRKSTDTWWWDCDREHDTSKGPVPWCGNELTQDEAYAALDRHNAEHHPTFARTTKDAP